MAKKSVAKGDKKPKSMRTAFIRVSAENNTKQGVVRYCLDDIVNICKEWSKSKSFYYYIMEHNNEPTDTNRHFHIVIDFHSPTEFELVKQRFPYGDIETAKNIKKCVQYLVHLNDLSKVAYNFEDMVTNDENADKYRYRTKSAQGDLLNLIVRKIEKGEIREYNVFEEVPIEIFVDNKTKIYNALEFARGKIMNNKDRNISVMIFTGDTGTYKTTYAKNYCKSENKSFCISSSSNDPMQDYKGEDVLILDDIRDTTFKFEDLLKILDNHTSSTMKARYSNKAFIGDTIIITSSLPLSEWYFNEPKEDKEQLYRRIAQQYQFTKDKIKVFSFDEHAHKYKFVVELDNIASFTVAKATDRIFDTLSAMGVQLAPDIKDKIEEQANKPEFEQTSLGDMLDMPFGDGELERVGE